MIKIYRKEETKTELKTPMLQIDKNGMDFVDEYEKIIVRVIDFKNCRFNTHCEGSLQAMRYRTDFANWDAEGRFCGFREDVG
jgi:hypothetical protein